MHGPHRSAVGALSRRDGEAKRVRFRGARPARPRHESGGRERRGGRRPQRGLGWPCWGVVGMPAWPEQRAEGGAVRGTGAARTWGAGRGGPCAAD